MLKVEVNSQRWESWVSRYIAETGKDVDKEMRRQGKFLAYELAAQAPPKAKSATNGLSPSNRKVGENKIKRAVNFFIRGIGSIGIASIADENSAFKLQEYAKSQGYLKSRDPVIRRIMLAAQFNDPDKALKNLRQYLNKSLKGTSDAFSSMESYPNRYYAAIKAKAKGQKASVIYTLSKNPNPDRRPIISKAVAALGQLKAGWIQAGEGIGANINKKAPAWLGGKKIIGSGSVTGADWKLLVTLKNNLGNVTGIESRTDYVSKALAVRTDKVYKGVRGVMYAELRKRLRAQGEPVPTIDQAFPI